MPTPVSALLHAATMVVAGVFLLLRISPLLEYSETSLLLLLWIGSLTAFMAATTGLFQNDLKRVIAYSTCSQLGMLMVACGLSQYNAALFHLVNHAFFKALLFLSAGEFAPALNSAICWELHLDGQSAGNYISELYGILRGHTLKISNIAWPLAGTIPRGDRKFSNEIGIKLNSKWNSYLAGLIDGDGCFYTPKKYRDNNNKIISPQITIAFNSKDLPLALLLQKNLNMGQIYKVKGKNAYYYRISNLKNLIKVINLINGYMRTPKINQLYNLINYINARGFNINQLPLDNSSLNSNAWLSGFIDADGHFAVRVSKNSSRLACTFELVQRQIDLSGEDYSQILSKISYYLLSNLKETKINTKNPQYRIRTTSLNGNLVLKDYLTQYQLFSSKFLDFLDYLKVLEFFIKKEHYNNVDKIIKIKSNMNNNRTYFNWDHLQNFYIIEN